MCLVLAVSRRVRWLSLLFLCGLCAFFAHFVVYCRPPRWNENTVSVLFCRKKAALQIIEPFFTVKEIFAYDITPVNTMHAVPESGFFLQGLSLLHDPGEPAVKTKVRADHSQTMPRLTIEKKFESRHAIQHQPRQDLR